jgi:hypothetical protein
VENRIRRLQTDPRLCGTEDRHLSIEPLHSNFPVVLHHAKNALTTQSADIPADVSAECVGTLLEIVNGIFCQV